ncbi:hypothetical protein [Actinomadura montaniterrae]|uniref:Uncharacterized protein n=1 Tax=Actinomadura montaniterrae TaxID=1803903 RepID=A0A6L3VWR3_9ACTN|nr:hypothetical protein [Actinomadura montaniterrae]KAB2384572.1 hypothetical protein F9B16_10650 [Actinomadura montaniterrae]
MTVFEGRLGSLGPDVDVTEPADLTMAAIQGGLLLAQVRRTPDQLRLALRGARAALEDALTPWHDAPELTADPPEWGGQRPWFAPADHGL